MQRASLHRLTTPRTSHCSNRLRTASTSVAASVVIVSLLASRARSTRTFAKGSSFLRIFAICVLSVSTICSHCSTSSAFARRSPPHTSESSFRAATPARLGRNHGATFCREECRQSPARTRQPDESELRAISLSARPTRDSPLATKGCSCASTELTRLRSLPVVVELSLTDSHRIDGSGNAKASRSAYVSRSRECRQA